jgi:glycosyltransferase involved in cell wall biosynthesis
MFSRTLPVDDLPRVAGARMRVARIPWNLAHAAALLTRKLGRPLYPRIDTRDFDLMIAETPSPGVVSPGTQMVVRYHDAIPILMPHTITDKSFHQAAHYHALKRNVKSGAWFACVSDATRRDLLSIFPEAATRSVTIHNMVLHDYYVEETLPGRIHEIIRTRQNARAKSGGALLQRPGQMPQYLLMVSTVEPRKNHTTLLAAWEQLRVDRFPDLKLVIVGSLGWDHKAIVRRFRPWLDHGDVQMLEDVPAAELRLLYRHAQATVCPSFGEGFDFAGVEAMRCGSVVAASDIPVHREVYQDAAAYFNPYSPRDAAQAIAQLIEADAAERRVALAARGDDVAARYLPERILPQWQRFLQDLVAAPAPA